MVLSFCCTVFQGLKHLHNNDMVHMDIKPANIFIGLDGLCKIGDFGLVLELSKVGIQIDDEIDSLFVKSLQLLS